MINDKKLYKLNPCFSSYDLESIAIDEAINWAVANNWRTTDIFSDSQASLKALNNSESKD